MGFSGALPPRARALLVVLLAMAATPASSTWAPANYNDFRCFSDPVFDERKGEAPRYTVDDGRITAAVEKWLQDPANGLKFFGHSVPVGTPGRVVAGAKNNTGWRNKGAARNALIFETNGWDTHFLTSWVAAILLKERVGYNVAHIQHSGAGGTFGRMAPTESKTPVHANVEVWPGGKAAQMKQWAHVTHNAGILGGFGHSGLFTTTKFKDQMQKQNYFVEYWRSLKVPAVVSALAYSPSPIHNASLLGECYTKAGGGAAGAEACTTCKAANTAQQCANGTYTSPACAAGGGAPCGVITMMDPAYDPGMVQQMVANLNLSFELPFVGYGAAQRHILERERNGEPVLFYHWRPDVFHTANPGKFIRVTLPEPTDACEARGNGDPSGGIDCDFPTQPMTKFHPADLAATAGSPATKFFRSFALSQLQLNELLTEYNGVGLGDGTDHFRAACTWIKAHPSKWSDWIEKWEPPKAAANTRAMDMAFYVLYSLILAAVCSYFFAARLRMCGGVLGENKVHATPGGGKTTVGGGDDDGELYEDTEKRQVAAEVEQAHAAHGKALIQASGACCLGSFVIGVVYLTVLDETVSPVQRALAGGVPIVGAVGLLPVGLVMMQQGHSAKALNLLQTIFPIVMMVEPLGMHFVLGGFQSSSAIIVWSLVAPVLAAQRGRAFAERLFLMVLVALIAAGILEYFDVMVAMVVPRKVQAWMFVLNIGGAMSVAVASITKFATVLKKQQDDISERKRLEKTRRTFLASFSHELRTPLSGILGMLELLSEQSLPSIARHYVHKAIISSNLLLNLVNDILDMSRIEAGQMKMRDQPFNVRRAVKAVLDLVASQAKVKRLKLARFVSSGVPNAVRGDVVRFRQIVLNLLSNAIKFTPQGAVTLRVDVVDTLELSDCQVVSAGTDSSNKYKNEKGAVVLKVEVEDTGVGMKQGATDRLFQMFSKISDDRVQNVLGCGIGLSICRHLVELMGGQIGVQTVYGCGSVFKFTILCNPFTEEKSKRIKGGADEPLVNHLAVLDGAKVLLAEDNAFNAEVLRTFLEHAKCRVTHASNGRAVVSHYISQHSEGGFDVVLMDCQMPIMDGYEATRQIRSWEKRQQSRRTPIVALTAYAMQGDRQRCISSGMDSVTTKPVTKPVLLREVARAIKGMYLPAGNEGIDEAGHGPEDTPHSEGGMSRWVIQDGLEGSGSHTDTTGGGTSGAGSHNDVVGEEFEGCSSEDSRPSSNGGGFTATPPSSSSLASSVPLNTPLGISRRLQSSSDADESKGGDPLLSATVSKDTAARQMARGLAGGAGYNKPGAIDVQLGLTQFGGSQQMYAQMLTHFATRVLPQGMTGMQTAHDRSDIVALRAEAHSLNGAAGFVGASMLSDLCMRLTDACALVTDGMYDKQGLENHITQIASEFGILKSWFKDTHAFHLEVEAAMPAAGALSAYQSCRKACSGRRVLVAEDDEFTRSALSTVFNDAGMAVTTCTDGEQAVALTQQACGNEMFDIIIMDSLMPKLHGAGACTAIRAWEKSSGAKRTPILGFSATVQGEEACMNAGMDAFVTKIQRTPILQTIALTLGLMTGEEAPIFKKSKSVAISPIEISIGLANFGGEQEFYKALENFYAGQLQKSAAAMHSAHAAHNITQLHKEAHALKTAAGFMGAMDMSRVCGDLQLKCGVTGTVKDEGADLDTLYSQFEIQLQMVKDFVMHKNGTGNPSPDMLMVGRKLPPLAATAPAGQGEQQAAVEAGFESWVVSNRMGDIREKLIELGVADYSDLAELDLDEIRELRAGLKKVAQRKFDKDLKRMGIPTDTVPALNASRNANALSLAVASSSSAAAAAAAAAAAVSSSAAAAAAVAEEPPPQERVPSQEAKRTNAIKAASRTNSIGGAKSRSPTMGAPKAQPKRAGEGEEPRPKRAGEGNDDARHDFTSSGAYSDGDNGDGMQVSSDEVDDV